MSTPTPAPIARTAAALLALEALVLLAIAAWEVVALVTSGAGSIPSALALVAMTLIGVVGVGAFAWGTYTGRSWGRSGGIVAQLLAIAVAVGSVTGAYVHPVIAVAIGVPAVIVLVFLVLSSRRAS